MPFLKGTLEMLLSTMIWKFWEFLNTAAEYFHKFFRIPLFCPFILTQSLVIHLRLKVLFPYDYDLLRSSHRQCSLRRGVLRHFAEFTEKHLCQGLLFNKVAGLRPDAPTFTASQPFSSCIQIHYFNLSKTRLWPSNEGYWGVGIIRQGKSISSQWNTFLKTIKLWNTRQMCWW